MIGAVSTLREWSRRGAAVGVFLPLIVAVSAQAQTVDTEDAADPSPRWLTLRQVDAFLEFEGEFGYTRTEIDGRGRQRDRRQTNRMYSFEERIGLTLDGSLIDPNLITFSGEITFALTQDRFEELTDFFVDQTDSDNGFLLEYDLRANILPGRQHSGTAYMLRQEDRISRRFQPTLNQERTGFGTHWFVRDEKIPMELSYDYLETDRTGNFDPRDDEHYTESRFFYGLDYVLTERHKVRLEYEHALTKQEYQGLRGGFETTRDLLILDHELRFGDDDRHEYRTRVHWQEESGDFARDFFEIGPQLKLQHSDTFQTLYKYQFNRERFAGLDIETQRVDFQAVHQLYTNLTTTFTAFALYEDVEDDVNTTQYGTSVDWQYNRRNPLGHFYANLALAYDTEEAEGEGGLRQIFDEAHTFRDPVSPTLRNRNVVPGSIIVTDTTNRRVFRAGIDYVVSRIGNAVQIARIRTGLIADGDTVLVDYQIFTPQDGQLDTIRVDFNVEQRFENGFTPYYRLSYRNQEDDLSTGFLRRADRTNHHRIGFDYEQERYTIGAEYEIFDDTIEPYDAYHLRGLYRILTGQEHTMNASARFSRLLFEGGIDDRNVNMVDVELDHRWRLTDALSTVERLAYRWEDDSIDGITNAWDVVAGVEYVVGDLSGEVTFEYDRLDLPRSTQDDFGVFVRIRREIRDVVAQ